jgi:hypothetical protein
MPSCKISKFSHRFTDGVAIFVASLVGIIPQKHIFSYKKPPERVVLLITYNL